MSKKRSDYKYPALVPKVNLKSRRDYIDNRYYFDQLPEDAKKFLNDFNEMYYCNSTNMKYGHDHLVEPKMSKEEIQEIHTQMKVLKNRRSEIYKKPAENTTEDDRNFARVLTEQIDQMEDFLDQVQPTRKMGRDNYARNLDFLNMNKAGNMYDLVSWETLRDDELNEVQEDAIYLPNKWRDDD